MKRLAIMVSVGAAVIAGAMSSRAAPPGPAASLTDDWAYYGAQGRAHIAQSGGHVTIEATWTPNPTPGPHYRIDATVVGQAIDGTWRCLVSPCAGRGGKFHAQISPDASQLTVSRTDDPGDAEQWNGTVFTRAPVSAEAMASALRQSGAVEVYDILFDTDRAVIKPGSAAIVSQIVALLKQDPGLKLQVSGHTDNTGGAAHNSALSKARADAVVAALTKAGIAAGRVRAQGFGDTRPIVANDSDRHRALNRRVELRRF